MTRYILLYIIFPSISSSLPLTLFLSSPSLLLLLSFCRLAAKKKEARMASDEPRYFKGKDSLHCCKRRKPDVRKDEAQKNDEEEYMLVCVKWQGYHLDMKPQGHYLFVCMCDVWIQGHHLYMKLQGHHLHVCNCWLLPKKQEQLGRMVVDHLPLWVWQETAVMYLPMKEFL